MVEFYSHKVIVLVQAQLPEYINIIYYFLHVRMAEWFKAMACKVIVVTRRGFESYSSYFNFYRSSMVERQPSKLFDIGSSPIDSILLPPPLE